MLLGEKPADAARLLLGRPTPCVGRDVELLQLEGLAASAIEDARPQAAVVIAPPGAGKSRLCRELLQQDRAAEAAELARQEQPVFDAMRSRAFSEVIFRVAVAEAFFAAGELVEGESALREALRQIERRASLLADPAQQAAYLGRAENRKAAELARTRL